MKKVGTIAILFSLFMFSASTLFLLPAVSAASGNSLIWSSGLKKANSDFAGYVLTQSSQKSGTLLLQSKWNIPSAACTAISAIIFDKTAEY
jgi:hypothetical protein